MSPHVAIFYDATLPVQRRAVSGILRYANTFGQWSVTLNEMHAKSSMPIDCRGILSCAPPPKQFHALRRLNLPLVLVNLARLDGSDLDVALKMPHVCSDSRAFGILAAEFFLSRTPRTFVYVGTNTSPAWDVERGEAFANRIRLEGIEPYIYKPLKSISSPSRNATHLQQWLASIPKPMSIFAANDERAGQVLTACKIADVNVPYEAEVLGVDNDEWICESMCPRLSSIPFGSEEGGFEAAKMLDALMQKEEGSDAALPALMRMMTPGEVVERETTNERVVEDPIVSRALAFIQLNKGLNIRVQDVSDAVNCKIGTLEWHFSKALGASVKDEIAVVRHRSVCQLVRNTSLPFQEIARRCGFTNVATLCRIIKKTTGQTMTSLRSGLR